MSPTKIHFSQIHYHLFLSYHMNFQNYTWLLDEYVALFKDHKANDLMTILSIHHNLKSY